MKMRLPSPKELWERFITTMKSRAGLVCVVTVLFFGMTAGVARDPLATFLSILASFSVFFIITLSLNIETGLTGIPQFGRVLAVLTGALAVASIPGRILAAFMGLPAGLDYGDDAVNYKVVPKINEFLATNPALSILVLLFSLLLAAACGAAIGWLCSRPAIRLREAYLGISLLAFGDVLMWIGHNWEPLVGGSTGVFVPDPFAFTGGGITEHIIIVSVLAIIAIGTLILVEMMTRSPLGRAFKMHRDCELAASVYGRDIVKVRTQSLMIGSALAAIGGALYVFYTHTCKAITFERATWTFWPWAYMMLGGVGSNIGMFFGVMLYTVIRYNIVVRRHFLAGIVPFDPIWLDMLLGGIMLILIVLFMPSGLVPEKPVTTLPPDKIKAMLENIKKRGKEKG